MAEANGGGKLEAARREMEDTMVVMAHLESKAAARIKEHAEFLADYDKRMAKQEQRSAALDKRVDDVVSAIGQLIARIPPSALA